jgi:hypothetical protein
VSEESEQSCANARKSIGVYDLRRHGADCVFVKTIFSADLRRIIYTFGVVLPRLKSRKTSNKS